MDHIKRILATLVLGLLPVVALADGCPPPSHDIAALRSLKAQDFAIANDADRQSLAMALLACLGSPDPELRDDIAFGAYSRWMRSKALPVETLRALSSRLQAQLPAGKPDGDGFGKPFAALVLSEVARTDRIVPWMTSDERRSLIDNGTAYLASVRDYRGFIDGQGWRHGVAHGADMMLQLSLNPALDKAQLDQLLAALASQVPAHGGHAYVHGEPGRLALPVLYIAKRNLHSQEEWAAWLAARAQLPEGVAADAVYRSQAALAWRSNVEAFLLQLYFSANESGDAELKVRLAPGVLAAIKQLP